VIKFDREQGRIHALSDALATVTRDLTRLPNYVIGAVYPPREFREAAWKAYRDRKKEVQASGSN
jgi:hypothetical protein